MKKFKATIDHMCTHEAHNVELWVKLVQKTEKNGNINETRYILDKFLELYPTSTKYWTYYIELEMSNNNLDKATQLFVPATKCCYDIDLYMVYIELSKQIHSSKNIEKDVFIQNVRKAYKFAVNRVGLDIKAYKLYKSFIEFLLANRLSTESQIDIMIIVRKIYQGIINLPIDDITKLWNDYIAWETKNSAQLAQSFKDKFYHEHGLAVNYYRERKRYYRGISFNNLLIKCSYISNSKYSIMKQDRDYNQIMLWEKLIDFELKNKQNVPNNVFLPRMEYIFKKALMVIRNYPDIWFMYIDFTKKYYNKNINNIERISKIYIDACKTLPDCVLLHLNYCDFIELNMNYFKNKNKAKNYYLQLIAFAEHQLAKIAKAKDKKKKEK